MTNKLIQASAVLAKELSSKKFPRENRAAYLTCFLNIGVIDDFLTALNDSVCTCDGTQDWSVDNNGNCDYCGLPRTRTERP